METHDGTALVMGEVVLITKDIITDMFGSNKDIDEEGDIMYVIMELDKYVKLAFGLILTIGKLAE